MNLFLFTCLFCRVCQCVVFVVSCLLMFLFSVLSFPLNLLLRSPPSPFILPLCLVADLACAPAALVAKLKTFLANGKSLIWPCACMCLSSLCACLALFRVIICNSVESLLKYCISSLGFEFRLCTVCCFELARKTGPLPHNHIQRKFVWWKWAMLLFGIGGIQNIDLGHCGKFIGTYEFSSVKKHIFFPVFESCFSTSPWRAG